MNAFTSPHAPPPERRPGIAVPPMKPYEHPPEPTTQDKMRTIGARVMHELRDIARAGRPPKEKSPR